MVLAAAGTAGRAFTDRASLFFALSVALTGVGFGNVVGAPVVKKYFPGPARSDAHSLRPAHAGRRHVARDGRGPSRTVA